jgi:hypothetical protein
MGGVLKIMRRRFWQKVGLFWIMYMKKRERWKNVKCPIAGGRVLWYDISKKISGRMAKTHYGIKMGECGDAAFSRFRGSSSGGVG